MERQEQTAEISVVSDTRYELPPEGITLLGYVVRRMHKTALLEPMSQMLKEGHTLEALAQVALYATGASTSFGPAYYQPTFNREGDVITEPDPATGSSRGRRTIGLRTRSRCRMAVALMARKRSPARP